MQESVFRLEGMKEYMFLRHNEINHGKTTLLFVHGLGESGLCFKEKKGVRRNKRNKRQTYTRLFGELFRVVISHLSLAIGRTFKNCHWTLVIGGCMVAWDGGVLGEMLLI